MGPREIVYLLTHNNTFHSSPSSEGWFLPSNSVLLTNFWFHFKRVAEVTWNVILAGTPTATHWSHRTGEETGSDGLIKFIEFTIWFRPKCWSFACFVISPNLFQIWNPDKSQGNPHMYHKCIALHLRNLGSRNNHRWHTNCRWRMLPRFHLGSVGARGPGPQLIYLGTKGWGFKNPWGILRSYMIVLDRNGNYLHLEISQDFATTDSQTKKNKDIWSLTCSFCKCPTWVLPVLPDEMQQKSFENFAQTFSKCSKIQQSRVCVYVCVICIPSV